jgi:beta-lactamase superfamily II metal-dependent hydrolase
LIEKEGKYALIDCGNDYRKVYLYLFKKGVSTLEYLIVTNPKAEHLGACDVILENIYVKEILDNGQPYNREPYKEYIKLAQERNHEIIYRGHEINLNDAKMEILWPPVPRPRGDLRRNSIVIRLTYGNIAFMLMSDCNTECENQLYGDLSAEVLKVGYQGSKFSTSQSFLNRVNPEIAIISVGSENTYGNPSHVTLSKLRNIEVHRTDLEGSIQVETDGGVYWIFTEHPPIVPTTTTIKIETTTTTSTTPLLSNVTTSIPTTTFTITSTTSTTSTTTTQVIITTTTTSTSTTIPGRCYTNEDCGGTKIVKNYTCKENKIARMYVRYRCLHPGTPSAECIGTYYTEVIKSCDEEREECVEDEQYCGFIQYGDYEILKEPPEGSLISAVNKKDFLPMFHLSLKIKYVVSAGDEPEGLCMFVKMPDGRVEKKYFLDKYGAVVDNIKIGVLKIHISDAGVFAQIWGMPV